MLNNWNYSFESCVFRKSKAFYVVVVKYSNKKLSMDRNSFWCIFKVNIKHIRIAPLFPNDIQRNTVNWIKTVVGIRKKMYTNHARIFGPWPFFFQYNVETDTILKLQRLCNDLYCVEHDLREVVWPPNTARQAIQEKRPTDQIKKLIGNGLLNHTVTRGKGWDKLTNLG